MGRTGRETDAQTSQVTASSWPGLRGWSPGVRIQRARRPCTAPLRPAVTWHAHPQQVRKENTPNATLSQRTGCPSLEAENIPLCMDTHRISFLRLPTDGLRSRPCPSCCDYCCHRHGGADVPSGQQVPTYVSWTHTQKQTCWITGQL